MLKPRPSQVYADTRVCCVRLACSQGGATAVTYASVSCQTRPHFCFPSSRRTLVPHSPATPLRRRTRRTSAVCSSYLRSCADVLPGTVQACMHNTNTPYTHTMTYSLYVTCLPLCFLARYKHEAYLWHVPMSFLARYIHDFTLQTQTQRPSPHLFS